MIARLLAVPELRVRYLAHVRTILLESFDWQTIGAAAAGLRAVLGDEIAKDTRKLYPLAAYESSLVAAATVPSGRRSAPPLQGFVEARRKFLLGHDALEGPWPEVASVQASWPRATTGATNRAAPLPGDAVTVRVQIGGEVKPTSVILYWATGKWTPFERERMTPGDDGSFTAAIPPQLAGTLVRYYVEARAAVDVGTTAFYPPRAERDALRFRVRAVRKEGFPVRIAEWLAANTGSATDPQGEADDWIKLRNTSDEEIDLSGMYLSDDVDNPRKWQFPKQTAIVPGGTLVVWADEDGNDHPGLHASFKLSRRGEVLLLVDRDKNGNAVLDQVEFGEQERGKPGSRD